MSGEYCLEHKTEIVLKKIHHWIEEIRDRDYYRETVYWNFYEYEKLYQDSQYDHIEMVIKGYDCNVKIRATNLRYIENLIKENFNKVYQDDGVNFSLIYRANGIVKTIFEFQGYTGRFKQENRTSIEKEFDKIRNNRDYPWDDYTYKAFAPQTTVFNLYKEEIRKAKGWT